MQEINVAVGCRFLSKPCVKAYECELTVKEYCKRHYG